MGETKLGLFGAFETQLRQLSQRQKVIAENIANSDTPGYRARDVAPSNFAKTLARATDGRASVASPQIDMPAAFAKLGSRAAAQGRSVIDKNVLETKPNGNTVSLEEQLAKQADVQMDYATITNLYKKQMGLIRTALGKGRG
jgi:flagellar basal-body rod protein FlgB